MNKKILEYLKSKNIKNFELKYNGFRGIYELTVFGSDRILWIYWVDDIKRIDDLLKSTNFSEME